ncbi:hypothetical protein [Variovorax ginsengisoli]|uniref:Uncharacterized protein n=1 Tax=Variovorax ginsengisoli TaxID=363844 RepID=A0ABT8S0Z5_9BURK|nr:hypothetical protein [Variovorax ginsengisoli]MDN8612777.1 hypothetical protein [Variovorax ginsengisoli]MDO1531947.1 hypothetical protein [Variovorax ginsengisoli]
MARRKVSQNEYHKAWGVIGDLEHFLTLDEFGIREMQMPPAEEWIAIAEKAAEGHDKPGTVRMTMAQVLSGMPPEHKGTE